MSIPRDKNIRRNRLWRLLCFIACIAVLLGIPMGIANYILSNFFAEVGGEIGNIIGLLVGGAAFANFAPKRLLVRNQGLTGCFTTTLGGDFIVYGPGTSLSIFTEDRGKRNSFPLEVDTIPFDVSLPTKTSGIIAKCELQWRYNLPRLMRATSLTQNTLREGAQGFVDSVISGFVSPLRATEALPKVGQANDLLAKKFMTTKSKKQGIKPSDFESQFGLDIISVFVKHFEFPKAVQDARDAVAVATSIHEIVQALYAPGDLDADLASGKLSQADYQTLVEKALVLAQDAKMNIVSLGGVDSAAKAVMGVIAAKGGI